MGTLVVVSGLLVLTLFALAVVALLGALVLGNLWVQWRTTASGRRLEGRTGSRTTGEEPLFP